MHAAHILVVDDDPANLEVLHLLLQQVGGYRVTTSPWVFDDLAQVQRLGLDLIVMDLHLGSCERGWSFLGHLTSSPLTKDLPLLLCTAALAEAREHEAFLTSHGIPVLHKPFEVDELLMVVSTLLSPRPPGP